MENQRKNDNLILNDLGEIKESVKELSTKMTTVETVLTGVTDAPGLCGIVKAHGVQISKLSNWRLQIMGGAIVIGTICGVLVKYFL